MILTSTYTLPHNWVNYLINGDDSGLDAADTAACDTFLATLDLDGGHCCQVGEPEFRHTSADVPDELAQDFADFTFWRSVSRLEFLSTITPHHPPPAADVRDFNVAELAGAIYPDIPCDYALPLEWFTLCLQHNFDPRGRFVWGYPPGSLFGQPLPLTQEAAKAIPARCIV